MSTRPRPSRRQPGRWFTGQDVARRKRLVNACGGIVERVQPFADHPISKAHEWHQSYRGDEAPTARPASSDDPTAAVHDLEQVVAAVTVQNSILSALMRAHLRRVEAVDDIVVFGPLRNERVIQVPGVTVGQLKPFIDPDDFAE